MAITIVETYVRGGYRYARVQVDSIGDTFYFKFPTTMTTAEMKAEGQRIIDLRIVEEQDKRAALQRRQAITDAIPRYANGALTTNQQKQLLDALIAEWQG